MTELNIEQVVPTFENLPEIVKKGLEIVAKNENFESYAFECKAGANIGDGFMGIVMKIVIRGNKNSTDGVELPVVCKIQHTTKARRELVCSYKVFEREVLSYKIFLKELENIQHEKGITNSEGFFNFPKVYYTHVDPVDQEVFILMEDLRHRGFSEGGERAKPLSIDQCEAVIKSIAKLHAASFCLKIEKPNIYVEFKSYHCLLSEFLMAPQYEPMFELNFTNIIKAFSDNERVAHKLTDMKNNLKDTILALVKDAQKTEFAVVGHGDTKPPNFMFSINDGGKIKDIAVIDWQMSRYASPVLDLTYFIFIAMDKALRDAHLSRLQKEYHTTLSQYLNKLGHNVDKVYPYAEYLKHWKLYGKFGLPMALVLVPIGLMSNEEIFAFDKMCQDMVIEDSTKTNMEKTDLRVQHRIKDIVMDMDDLGYI